MDRINRLGPVAVIGAGSMAEALIAGLIARGLPPDRVRVTNRRRHERLQALGAHYRVHATAAKSEAVAGAQVVVLATKPGDAQTAAAQLAPWLTREQVVISVVAGLHTTALEQWCGEVAVVRAMPNTSCRVGESATALAPGRWCRAAQQAVAATVFAAVGEVTWVDEKLMDAVTALSGSGPAYVYYLVEALEEAGIAAGLPRDVTRRLAVRTVLGAGRMLAELGEEPGVLRGQVTSPGGTTAAGIRALDAAGFRSAVVNAVGQAVRRAGELSADSFLRRS